MISIIIPVYNVEQYLKQCLNSIVNQSYEDIEIILIDDGSTDTSGIICQEYADKDHRIQVYYKEHEGPAEVRNFGLKKAKGDYIGFVDSDDYIDLNMYLHLYKACEKYNADISIINYAAFEDDIIYHQKVTNQEVVFKRDEVLKLFIEENSKYMVTPAIWSKLFKREVILGLEFPRGKVCGEDLLFTTQAFIRADKIVYLDEELYFYRQHSGSIMNSMQLMEKRISDEIEQYKKRIILIKALDNDNLFSACECSLYKRMILRYSEFIKNRATKSEYAQNLLKQILIYRKKVDINSCIKSEKKQYRIKSLIMYYYPQIYFKILGKRYF